jgi:hypothetical protein
MPDRIHEQYTVQHPPQIYLAADVSVSSNDLKRVIILSLPLNSRGSTLDSMPFIALQKLNSEDNGRNEKDQ